MYDLKESQRKERLLTGRTSEELYKHLEEQYPTLLTVDEKNNLVSNTMSSQSSFTRLQELFFYFHH